MLTQKLEPLKHDIMSFTPQLRNYSTPQGKLLLELRKSYCQNPDYPGFKAMIDTLSTFRLSNNIIKLSPAQVSMLSSYFIADVLIDGVYRLVFGLREESVIKLTTAEGENFQLTEDEFKKQWSGLVIDLSKSKKPGFIEKFFKDLTAIL